MNKVSSLCCLVQNLDGPGSIGAHTSGRIVIPGRFAAASTTHLGIPDITTKVGLPAHGRNVSRCDFFVQQGLPELFRGIVRPCDATSHANHRDIFRLIALQMIQSGRYRRDRTTIAPTFRCHAWELLEGRSSKLYCDRWEPFAMIGGVSGADRNGGLSIANERVSKHPGREFFRAFVPPR